MKEIKGYTEQKIDRKGFEILNEIKGSIRQSRSISSMQVFRIRNKKKIHFLDMPFYRKGQKKRKDISKNDIDIVKGLIKKIKPHQIYAAGDLSDPHGTHRLCLRAIYRSIDKLKKFKFMKDCNVWLYKGAWNEWKVEDIEMSVPLSPDQVIYSLVWLMVLVTVGTVAQKDIGLYASQQKYFSSYFFFIGPLPLPGGRVVLALMLINLVSMMFKQNLWKMKRLV